MSKNDSFGDIAGAWYMRGVADRLTGRGDIFKAQDEAGRYSTDWVAGYSDASVYAGRRTGVRSGWEVTCGGVTVPVANDSDGLMVARNMADEMDQHADLCIDGREVKRIEPASWYDDQCPGCGEIGPTCPCMAGDR